MPERFLKKRAIEYSLALGGESLSNRLTLKQLPVTVIYDCSGKPVGFDGWTKAQAIEAAAQQPL